MGSVRWATVLLASCLALPFPAIGDKAVPGRQLLETHCAGCHGDAEPQGGFRVQSLAERFKRGNLALWRKSLEYVQAEFMPPPEAGGLLPGVRRQLVAYLDGEVARRHQPEEEISRPRPRRLNNRELANSVRDALMIEDVGTHHPFADLLGDTLQDGFDTIGDALGMSQFHLERYIDAFRKVVDATVLVGERPQSRRYEVTADDMLMTSLSQRRRQERANRTAESIDFLDPRLRVYFSNFERAPHTGRYRIKIRAVGKDRGVYDSAETGIYDGDPIRLGVHLGDRVRVVDLPDDRPIQIELDEWIAAGTRLELSHPTDGLRLRGNGNFKFQFSIAHDHIRETDPDLYSAVLGEKLPKAPARTARNPRHWSHWTEQWQGPRPRLFAAEIEGPLYESWPPKRQTALLGEHPTVQNAAAILLPIAERAWRRRPREGELDPIVRLVTSRAEQGRGPDSDIEALKEGIVAILASPAFLLVDSGDRSPAEHFASKLSNFLRGTIPDSRTLGAARRGGFETYEAVRDEVSRQFERGEASEFLREFPRAWLELDRINFMAPDPDRFPLLFAQAPKRRHGCRGAAILPTCGREQRSRSRVSAGRLHVSQRGSG